MHGRKILTLLLCVCLVISVVPVIRTAAKLSDSIIYQQDGVEIYYGVDSSWSGAFNAHFIIRNISHQDIENWGLRFEFSNDISNIWNGTIIYEENHLYTVKNIGYNQDIKKNSEVYIGFTANGDDEALPSNTSLCSAEYVVEGGYSTKFSVNSDWESGFSGTIELSNTGKEPIEDWTLEFDFSREIDNIWNGTIIKHEGNHYIIKNSEYNQRLLPNQSVIIGFNGYQGNIDTETIYNVSLSSFGIISSNYEVDGSSDNYEDESKGIVKIDTSMLVQDGENIFYIPKDIYSIKGTVGNSKNLISLTYTSNNTFGLNLLSGELTVNGNNWVIENIPLIIGYNEFTVTALYNDDTVSSDTVIIANIYKDKTIGLEAVNVDSDMDGLEDYIEAIYGTNSLSKDTDEDGLSDYTELVDIGTDPLKKDTDDNGIIDGDEDYDRDGLLNKEEEILGTLLFGVDSDYDDLTDYDEVNIYLTNPLAKDTDEDGASDGFEVTSGYNPLQADTDFTVNKEVVVGGTTYELQLTSCGENIESLTVEPINDSGAKYGRIMGYLDPAVDFNINGKFKFAKLKISFDDSYLDIEGFVPALYYIDEENHEMVEMPGDWDGVSNYFYVDLPHFSAYITLNKTNFLKVWEYGIKAHAITSDGKTNLNIVFVTDLSGSMGRDRIYTLKESLNDFIGVLTPYDKAGIVSFTSSATVLSELTSNKSTLKQIVNAMSVGGTTAIYTGLDKAVEMLDTFDEDGFKMIILFTDGYDEPSTTYDNQYRSIIDRAVGADIIVHTVGIGSIDDELLSNIAHSTGGSFYYAENASNLQQQVAKVQEEVNDKAKYTRDSNNDGISDYYTKLLCDDLLFSWDHQPIIIDAEYEDIQNDLDGDFDNDGLRNGSELLFTVKENQIISIIVNSDMEKTDTDYDSYTDKIEKNNGTNPKVKDISESDFNNIIVNHGNYAASQSAMDYMDSETTKFMLASGNFLFNGKISYVKDYEIALINFINAYNKATITDKICKKYVEIYESDYNTLVSFLVESTTGGLDTAGNLANYVEALKKAKDQIISEMLPVAKKFTFTKSKPLSANYIAKRNALVKYINESNELQNKIDGVPGFIVNISPKTQSILKRVGTIVTGLSITLGIFDDLCNSSNAFAALNAEIEQSDYIIEYLTCIVDNSEIDELREAASRILDAIQINMNEAYDYVVIQDFLDNAIQTGEIIAFSKMGPYAWAASLGLAVGDFLGGTGAVDEESIKIIAFGHSADTYANYIRWKFENDNFTSYHLVKNDEQLQLLQLLSQLRIVGEDSVGKGYDNYGPAMHFLHFLAGVRQDEVESDLKQRIGRIESIGEKLGYYVTGQFYDAYLKYE
jgi:uncharacterized protein YegL